MRSQLVRGIGVAGLLACLAPVAQAQKGFELGGDAAYTHYSFNRPSGITPANMTSLTLPISSLRIAFPTDAPFEPEISAGLVYSKTGSGNSTTSFTGDVGLLMELNHELDGGWFIRPAIGWQRGGVGAVGNASVSRATLGAGMGVRVGMTDRIASRFEARYTYLTEAQGVSANAIGLLAGISVYTQSSR
jgi:hypothetical protein